MSAPDQTRIVNAALKELGSTKRVTSIDEAHNVAQLAKELWPDVLRDLLEDHPWNFATRRTHLNQTGTAPAFGYQRRFALPEDFVKWLPSRKGERDHYLAEIEDGALLSNGPAPFPFRYVRYHEEVPNWPPGFARAMIFALAASMAEGVTQSESIKDRMERRAADKLRTAKRRDGLQTGATKATGFVRRSDWLGQRRRSWVGPYGR